MILDIVYILLGLALLVKGGDYLVDGSVAIAKRAKLSEMVIGLTVVGFGTSMPELLVSAQSAWMGNSGIAIGNVVGSNISNIALILGLTSIVNVIPAQKITLRISVHAPFLCPLCGNSHDGLCGACSGCHRSPDAHLLRVLPGSSVAQSQQSQGSNCKRESRGE